MSLNSAHANGGVLIYNGEIILLFCDGVELVMEGSDTKDFGGTKKGRIYLTTHRMIFTNKSEKDPLKSFSFPFFSMTSIELEQPVFGANFIKGVVNSQIGGNWSGTATFKLKFFSGGAIEFGRAMLQAAKMASRYTPAQPPPYTPYQGAYHPAQPPSYMPPAGGVYGFVPPTQAFPNAPPANSVYTMDMPPPYPGIYPPPYAAPPGSYAGNPQAPPQWAYGASGYPGGPPPPAYGGNPEAPAQGAYGGPPPPGLIAGAAYPPPAGSYPPPQYPQAQNQQQQQAPSNPNDAKAQEAMQMFYQDPQNPQYMYQAAPNGYQEAPPPYYEGYKKNQ